MTIVHISSRTLVVILAFMVLITSAPRQIPPYCLQLDATARRLGVQSMLENWVDEHLTGEEIPTGSIEIGDGVWPGWRWLRVDFDGDQLGFGPTAHVRLIGPQPRHVLENTIAGSVQSVFFGDRSRYGIVVRARSNASFGLDPKYLIPISERVSVVCFDVPDPV